MKHGFPKICKAYQTPETIRARLAVLDEKNQRIRAYNETVAAGSPDVSLLDEKQLLLLGFYGAPGERFPDKVLWTLGWTVALLRDRLLRLERRAAA